jgi:immune inhibitor A
MSRRSFAAMLFGAMIGCFAAALAAEQKQSTPADLPGFKTVAAAQSTTVSGGGSGTHAGYLGVQVETDASGKLRVVAVEPGSPAAEVGVREGDLIVSADGKTPASIDALRQQVQQKDEGDVFPLKVLREGKSVELIARLSAVSRPMKLSDAMSFGGGRRRGLVVDYTRPQGPWKKPVMRLALVGIEFADVKHNQQIKDADWEAAFFSAKTYTDKSATGQSVFGSVNDYFAEQSCGAFHLQGKMLGWIEVSKKRGEYAQGADVFNRHPLLIEAVGKLSQKSLLDDFDAVAFIYAGARVQTNRGGIFFPHASSVIYRSRGLSCIIFPEGEPRMSNISAPANLLGRVLGLPDLSDRPGPISPEGAGIWCAMGNVISDGRPQHLSAWCKEQLGWLQPTVIDPSVRQKLVLSPIEGSNRQCFKVLVRRDGSEYFLLENRHRNGFDSGLPGEGLLIWRVVDGRPRLEASHGVLGPTSPRIYLSMVPYPSTANSNFTPDTTPSSRSQLAGGMPVYITDVQRLPDGRITFAIGYQLQ